MAALPVRVLPRAGGVTAPAIVVRGAPQPSTSDGSRARHKQPLDVNPNTGARAEHLERIPRRADADGALPTDIDGATD